MQLKPDAYTDFIKKQSICKKNLGQKSGKELWNFLVLVNPWLNKDSQIGYSSTRFKVKIKKNPRTIWCKVNE